ncbi:MAG: cation diffusion facilitator family transporter [Chloroflexota bacterium]
MAALSVASNLMLTLLKLMVGIWIGSVSVVAEAIHSGVDLLASLIALFAVRSAAKPPDEEHPYGHGKVENVSGTVEALLIFIAAGLIIFEAVGRVMRGFEPPVVDLGLVVMAISAGANVLVSRRLLAVAKATDSVALEADAYHLTTDVVTSVGVFVGLVVVKLTGWAILDPLVAIFVALIIIKAAWDITQRSFVDLLDRSLPKKDRERIAAILDEHGDKLVSYHQVRSRKAGSERYIDLHLVVDGSANVKQTHDLCDHLEQDLHDALGTSTVTIHVEPCIEDCAGCQEPCEGEEGPTSKAL